MKDLQQGRDATWLDLSEAADFLGVHFTTLRRWVDAGKVPHIRTPGGRRRFRRAELETFLVALGQGATGALTSTLEGRSLVTLRANHLGVAGEAWYAKIGQTERDAMRAGGRQLMAVLMQYAGRANGGEAFLLEGKRLAAYYGEACRQAGLSLGETLQAFLSVRHAIFDSVYEAGSLAGLPDADTWRMYDRMNDFLDTMLLACVDAFIAMVPALSPSTGD